MACDRDQLMRDIQSGARLRPTKTVDKSKPIILVEGERLKSIVPLQQQNESVSQINNPPSDFNPAPFSTSIPPPPPPPPPGNLNFSATLPKRSNSKSNLVKPNLEKEAGDSKIQNGPPPDRDALMQAIRHGVTLRKIKNGDDPGPKKIENDFILPKKIIGNGEMVKHESTGKLDQSIPAPKSKIHSILSSANDEPSCQMIKKSDLTQIRPSMIKQNHFYPNGKCADTTDSPNKTAPNNSRRDSNPSAVGISENGNGNGNCESNILQKWSPSQESNGQLTGLEKRSSISDAVANFEKRISPESTEKRLPTATIDPNNSMEKRHISETVFNYEKRVIPEPTAPEKRDLIMEKRVRPHKLLINKRSDSSCDLRSPEYPRPEIVSEMATRVRTTSEMRNRPDADVKNGTESDQKSDFALTGFVNGAKALWEKRKSIDELAQNQPIQSIPKSNAAPVLRFFNGPDYPESIGTAPPLPTNPVPQSIPIRVDTNFHHPIEVSIRKSNSEYCLQMDDTLPKVDHLRRAWEKSEPKSCDLASSTLRRQQQAPNLNPNPNPNPNLAYAPPRQHHRSESLDCGDGRVGPPPATKTPQRFLPDVGALKQRFEEKAMEERGRIIKPPVQPVPQQQITTSTASSGYSSGSPSPKSSEKGPAQNGNGNRFQFSQNGTSTLDRRRNQSDNQLDGPKSMNKIDKRSNVEEGSMKGSYVANNPHIETVGPFKASMGTLGGGGGDETIKKNRNYYRSPPDPSLGNHQNGNANDTATWIVKKGSVPNTVTKYAVCEHLEALHQRKISTSNGSGSGEASAMNMMENGKQANEEVIDGEVARLLGIPFEKLKELRFDIDVNDPEGSLLRIQKRYNQVS